MKMTSMKRTKAEMKLRDAMCQPAEPSSDEPVYPWGLEINLEDASLEKLGLDVGDYKVGDTIDLQARVEVRSISQNKSTSGSRQSMSLQITDLGLSE